MAATAPPPPPRHQGLTSGLVTGGGDDCGFALFVSRLKGSSGDAQGETGAEG